MMDWDKVAVELEKPLSPEAVKPPPQGKYGEYVEALHVIREANRIFGFDGWKYQTETLQLTNSAKNGEMHHVGYLAIVRVTIGEVQRSDVGHGQGHGRSEGDAHDSAVKEAVTDALKRSLRTFGNTFGLALYEKDKNRRQVGHSPTNDEIREAIAAINDCGTADDLKTYWLNLYKNARHVADDQRVIEAKDYRKSEFEAKDAA